MRSYVALPSWPASLIADVAFVTQRADLGTRAIDRAAAQGFVEGHLAMYLPPMSMVDKVMRAMQQSQTSAMQY